MVVTSVLLILTSWWRKLKYGIKIVFFNDTTALSRDRTSVGHGDDGLDAITSNQRINTTLCKIKTSMYLKSSKKKNYN